MALVSRPWGVTPALVASRVQSLRLTETSQPSIADVTAMISEDASWVAARLRRVGVGPDLDDQSETYSIARRVVFDLVISRVAPLRGREESSMASQIMRDAERVLDSIEVGPQGLGDAAEGAKNHRVQTSHSARERVRSFNDAHASLGVRLATRRGL